ncbi:MAG: hypothetical protein MJ058_03355 [Akkermansia sp.]|nr:hypothetical protein [Akkermansia sp.]
MNTKTKKLAWCLCALMLCGCSKDAASIEDRISDTREILEDHRGNINQEMLKATLAGAEKGDPESEWKLGGLMLMIFTYVGGDDDALELENFWFQKAAEDGCPYAMLDLAMRLNGVKELPEEKRAELARKGVQLIQAKAEKNEQDARYLSSCYAEGIGVEKDLDTAYKWYVQFIEKAEPSPERRKAAIERWRASYNMPPLAE